MNGNNKTSHWFGHSKCKPLDLGDFYKRKRIINELEANLNTTTIEQSDSGMEHIPDLLQVAEVENANADLTTDASQIYKDNDDMNISETEEHKTVGYQAILIIDVINTNKNIKTIWRLIYEVIGAPLFEETNIFTQHFLELCKKIQINLSLYHLISK